VCLDRQYRGCSNHSPLPVKPISYTPLHRLSSRTVPPGYVKLNLSPSLSDCQNQHASLGPPGAGARGGGHPRSWGCQWRHSTHPSPAGLGAVGSCRSLGANRRHISPPGPAAAARASAGTRAAQALLPRELCMQAWAALAELKPSVHALPVTAHLCTSRPRAAVQKLLLARARLGRALPKP